LIIIDLVLVLKVWSLSLEVWSLALSVWSLSLKVKSLLTSLWQGRNHGWKFEGDQDLDPNTGALDAQRPRCGGPGYAGWKFFLKNQMLNPAFCWLLRLLVAILAVKFLAFWKLRPILGLYSDYPPLQGRLSHLYGVRNPAFPFLPFPFRPEPMTHCRWDSTSQDFHFQYYFSEHSMAIVSCLFIKNARLFLMLVYSLTVYT